MEIIVYQGGIPMGYGYFTNDYPTYIMASYTVVDILNAFY
jgi:hypothetical protein